MPTRKTLIVLLAGGIALALVFSLNRPAGHQGPPLAKSCSTPGIALSSKVTGDGTNLEYSITGPPAGTYVVAVDAVSVSVKGDGVTAIPPGAFGAAIRRGLKDCAYSGSLPNLAVGPHTVVLFRDGREVARASLSE